MKKSVVSALALAAVICAGAGEVNMRDKMYLHSLPMQQRVTSTQLPANAPVRLRQIAAPSESVVPVMVKLQEGCDAESLSGEGVTVLGSRFGFAYLTVEPSALESLANHKSVKQLELSRPVYPKMDRARALTGIDKIHNGVGLPASYTGKGVLCGIVDTGFDPNHANFLDENGNNRISTFSKAAIVNNKINIQYYDPSTLPNLSTDDYTTYHGTHTLGIMAGSYRDEVYGAVADENGNLQVGNISNPYYGVAYEADLAVGAGSSYDALIAYNLENIINYAEWSGQRAVVNMSLGSSQGPHDGCGIMNQFLDLASEPEYGNLIICLAAGNEGDLPITLNRTFTSEQTDMKTFIYPMYYGEEYGNIRYGSVELYSDTDKDFTLSMVVYNKSRKRVAWRKTITISTDGEPIYYCSSDDWVQDSSTDVTDTTFGEFFDGYVGFGSTYYEESGRYYAIIDFYITDSSVKNSDGNYIFGFEAVGSDGQRIDAYGDGFYTCFQSYGQEGWDDGMTNGTVSDMATGKNVIVVGSYNSKESWPTLDGSLSSLGEDYFPNGDITLFSSYGTLLDGRNLPHICAPGVAVVSSMNKSYLDAVEGGYSDSYLTAIANDGNRDYCFAQSIGTSMATPVVAGSIALWLEANPELTYADVMRIIEETAIVDEGVLRADPVQRGAGKFDAYAGLKKALEMANVTDVVADNESRVVFTPQGENRFTAFLAGARALDVRMFNMSGTMVMNLSCNGNEALVDASSLAPGVYVVSVNGNSSKIVIK